MIRRLLQPLKTDSFFLFGARGTGKSTYVEEQFLKGAEALRIDLLDADEEERFSRDPKLIERIVAEQEPKWVFIDEVQKVPKLLDHVHRLIEKRKQKFVLSGSSSRKLKRQGANLLAGRAFLNRLFPFTTLELGDAWDLDRALQWGTLPKAWLTQEEEGRRAYLRSYVQTYLREEIRVEQLVRELEPFRGFLEVSAQMSGKIVNYSRMAREVGTTDKTIGGYFQILQDTHLGFYLPAFHRSTRKAQSQHPKFYWFDPGVKRQLDHTIDSRLIESTSAYGEAFEHWVILEILRRAEYAQKDWQFSYFRTKEENEIDLIISPSRNEEILVEIKSSKRIDEAEVRYLNKLSTEFRAKRIFYLSRDPAPQKIGHVRCLPWEAGVNAILGQE
jgi:predicted AAA+ superfamily ATPase